MAGEDGYFVPNVLQANRSVDEETLGTTDAQVWMKEDNPLALRKFIHFP